jgi:hypothetical protein
MLAIDGEYPGKLLRRETAERIIGGTFEVYGELGRGFP